MRKLAPAIALAAILLFAASCHDRTVAPPYLLQATYGGTQHHFWSAQGLFIYQSSGYGVVQGIDTLAHDSLSVAFTGTNTGTYPVGAAYNSSINLTRGSLHYSTQDAAGHGTVIISKLDPSTMYATGTFRAVLVNTADHTDSLTVTEGSISVPYQ